MISDPEQVIAYLVDSQQETIGQCSFFHASKLLSTGQARVIKFYPYTLKLSASETQFEPVSRPQPLKEIFV